MASDQDRITALERQLKQLQQQFQPISTFFYQRGAIQGVLNAGRIGQGPSAKSALWMNLDGNSPGSAPIITMTDPNGTLVVQIGNLAAYTDSNGISSPAGPGIRVLDSSGNIISDSIGISQVMKQLGNVFSSSTFNVTSGTPTLITGVTVSFNLSRTVNVLMSYGASMSINATNDGGVDTVDLFIDGTNKSPGGLGPAIELQFAPTANGAVTSSGLYVQSLAAGSHTIQLRAARNGTNTPQVLQAGLIIFQVGG